MLKILRKDSKIPRIVGNIMRAWQGPALHISPVAGGWGSPGRPLSAYATIEPRSYRRESDRSFERGFCVASALLERDPMSGGEVPFAKRH